MKTFKLILATFILILGTTYTTTLKANETFEVNFSTLLQATLFCAGATIHCRNIQATPNGDYLVSYVLESVVNPKPTYPDDPKDPNKSRQ